MHLESHDMYIPYIPYIPYSLNILKVVPHQYNYVAFLDASKAFEKITLWLLFKKIIDRQMPLYLVKRICY